jgi:hypothetical protein
MAVVKNGKRWMYDDGERLVEGSCHHRKEGACGGCYARAIEALTQLAAADRPAADLVQLRYFGGLTVPEAADVLGISPRTADRLWTYARAWLHDRVKGGGETAPE